MEAQRNLGAAGVAQPRLEARWLLARVLGIAESQVLAHPDEAVEADAECAYRDAIRRREGREPFAYVVGEREFYGRAFRVDSRVLVPRPETETLVGAALAILEARASELATPPLLVDVGTGSGAIACTLALEAPRAWVIGCDVSSDALAVAAENRGRHHLQDRLLLVQGDLLSWLGPPVDLVVANLPYIPSARVPTLMPEVAAWEPRLALDGGPDGLGPVRALLADVARAVRPGGAVLLELDPEQVEPARALLPGAASRVIRDLAGLDRVLRLDVP